ncbi:glycosyltransferase family 2 protein [Candidatus Omnitrophota bacterium]
MKQKKDTLVIIPVLNEEKNIAAVIDELHRVCNDIDIMVINDGSTDATTEILQRKKVLAINHSFNMGIGVSFQTGCQYALKEGYRYIVRMDGDGQHNPRFINTILEPIKNDYVDIVIGSRFLGKSEFISSRPRLIGIKIISLFLSFITRKKITDPTSGFCAMNKKAFSFFSKVCPDDYPEPEILVYHRNFKIKEFPIPINKRLGGISSITPLKSLYYMLKVLFSLFVHIFRDKKAIK